MTLRFLCIRHRQLLSANPASALTTWRQSYETGLRLEQQGKDCLALRHAGCAMETAAIILDTLPSPSRHDVVRYCHSVRLLARLLQRQRADHMAAELLDEASDALKGRSLPGVDTGVLNAACQGLQAMGRTSLSGQARALAL